MSLRVRHIQPRSSSGSARGSHARKDQLNFSNSGGTYQRKVTKMIDHMLKYTDTVDRPVLNRYGEVDRFACTVMDVTECKHAQDLRGALGQPEAGLAQVSGANTIAEISASLTHELPQPIAATLLDADACLSWLAHDPPNLQDKRAAAMDTANDLKRAADITKRVRQFFKKGTSQWELVNIDESIRE